MVIQFEKFNVLIISNFEIKHRLVRFTQEVENIKFTIVYIILYLCTQYIEYITIVSTWTFTAISHKIWRARRTDMNMKFMLSVLKGVTFKVLCL